MFCATVSGGTRLISWKIMPMPAASRPRGSVLREFRSVDLDPSSRRSVDAVQDLEDRRFASAVLAEQGMDLARADFDTDVVERADAAEGLRHSG